MRSNTKVIYIVENDENWDLKFQNNVDIITKYTNTLNKFHIFPTLN